MLTWFFVVLFAVVVLQVAWSSVEKRKADEASAAAAAQMQQQKQRAAEQAATRLKSDCVAKRAEILTDYQAKVQNRKFDLAYSAIYDCSRATGDAELRKLADTARIADLRDTAGNTKYTASARLIAIDMLQRDYPQELDKKTEQLQSALLKQRAGEEAAAKRQEAAAKRREGVRIGMTKKEVLASSWGRPEHVNRTTYSWGTKEQWVYGTRSYLYFKDDVLEAIQN